MKNHLTRKVGFEETPNLGPCWKTTSFLQGQCGVEIKIESVNKDNSYSWVRISRGLNKFVTDSSNNKEDDNNEQETSEMQFEDCALKTNVLALASRSKAKPKPQRRTLACSSTRTVPIGERTWTDIEPEDYSPIAHPVSKQLITLLRHGDLPREEERWSDWILEMKGLSRNVFVRSQHWSDELWKSKMAGGGGNKKRFQYCTDPWGPEILYLRALQGHSRRNLVDLSLQDNVLITNDFFEYIYHIGCAINSHSTNSGLIPGGHNLSKRQTVFFTSVDLLNKEPRDPGTVDLKAPHLAWYHQKTWKKHQNTVYWVDVKLAHKKG